VVVGAQDRVSGKDTPPSSSELSRDQGPELRAAEAELDHLQRQRRAQSSTASSSSAAKPPVRT